MTECKSHWWFTKLRAANICQIFQVASQSHRHSLQKALLPHAFSWNCTSFINWIAVPPCGRELNLYDAFTVQIHYTNKCNPIRLISACSLVWFPGRVSLCHRSTFFRSTFQEICLLYSFGADIIVLFTFFSTGIDITSENEWKSWSRFNYLTPVINTEAVLYPAYLCASE